MDFIIMHSEADMAFNTLKYGKFVYPNIDSLIKELLYLIEQNKITVLNSGVLQGLITVSIQIKLLHHFTYFPMLLPGCETDVSVENKYTNDDNITCLELIYTDSKLFNEHLNKYFKSI